MGGAAVPPQLLDAWEKRGVRLRQLYGMTETGGGFMALSFDEALRRPDRCGHGGALTEVRVLREDGIPSAPGEVGRIEVRGATCTPGYWRDPQSTAEFIVDGWLRTGDLGELDADGYLRFVSRAKDLIITGGFNVAPAEIEEYIDRFPEVAEVAVLSAPDDKWGEVPIAIVRLSSPLSEVELTARCARSLADFKVPKRVVFMTDELPRTRFGKVAKDVLRTELLGILGADLAVEPAS